MWDDLYARERDTALAMAASRPPEAPEVPGFWANAHKAVGLGIMEGGAKAGQALMLAGSAVPRLVDTFAGGDNLTGETLTERYFDALGEPMQRAIDHWSLPSESVGTAGRVLYGVGQIALPLMAGAGNPALLMATQGFGTSADLVRQGVDANTAGAAGTVSAFTTGVGMMLPMAGRTLAQSLAIGAGGNVATGMFDRAALRAILQHADYGKIAAQYKVFDPEQMAAEALIGSVFGAVAHAVKPPEANAPELTPDEHAAALTLNAAATRDADTLVKPGDVNGMTAAHDAQVLAASQIDAGQPVSVAHLITPDAPTVEAARAMAVERMTADMRAELLAEAGNRTEPGEIAAARAEREALASRIEEAKSEQAIKDEAKAQQKQGLSRKEAESAAAKVVAQRLADIEAQAARLDAIIERNRRAALAEQDLAALERGEIPDRFGGAVEDQAEAITRGFQRRPIADAVARAMDEPAPVAATREPSVAREPAPGEATSSASAPETSIAQRIAADQPDRLIRMEDGRDVRAADLMREMDSEFKQDVTDAKAFEAAAQCFLQTGATA